MLLADFRLHVGAQMKPRKLRAKLRPSKPFSHWTGRKTIVELPAALYAGAEKAGNSRLVEAR